MGNADKGLTLEKLAQRLEALERENAELRQEVSALRGSGARRDEVVALRGSDEHRDQEESVSEFKGRVSRRSLLSKAGTAAVVAVAAGTLLNPREAKAADDVFGNNVYATNTVHGQRQVIGYGGNWTTLPSSDAAVVGRKPDGPGVEGISNAITGAGVEGTATGNLAYGVRGTGFFGVWGESDKAGGYGISGRNTNTDGTGVRGVTNDTDGRTGVRGEGATGVWGSSTKTGYSGVYGQHTGSGYGIVGDGRGLNNAGVLGRNPTGAGVRGEGIVHGVHGKSTAGGTGVFGESESGYAGAFSGGKAQLRVVPKATAGKPTTGAHAKGELYMDSKANLFVCTIGGTPGTWRRFATAVS